MNWILSCSVQVFDWDAVMKCSCCNEHLWKVGLFLSRVSGTLGSPLMGKQSHCHYISYGFLFNPVDAMTILFCKWRKYTWARKRAILLRGAKFKNGNVVLWVGLYLNACDYEINNWGINVAIFQLIKGCLIYLKSHNLHQLENGKVVFSI